MYRAGRNRQSVFWFVVEPVQSASERFVKLTQVVWQSENEPELLRGLQMNIRQDVEGQVQFLVHGARIAFEFRSAHDDLRPNARISEWISCRASSAILQ